MESQRIEEHSNLAASPAVLEIENLDVDYDLNSGPLARRYEVSISRCTGDRF